MDPFPERQYVINRWKVPRVLWNDSGLKMSYKLLPVFVPKSIAVCVYD